MVDAAGGLDKGSQSRGGAPTGPACPQAEIETETMPGTQFGKTLRREAVGIHGAGAVALHEHVGIFDASFEVGATLRIPSGR